MACGQSTEEPAPETAVPLTAEQEVGKTVFSRDCAACHSLIEETIVVGPPMAGIAGRAGERVQGQDARTYLYNSILDPADYIVDGFQDLMPTNFGKQLTGEEMDAVVAYMLTLE